MKKLLLAALFIAAVSCQKDKAPEQNAYHKGTEKPAARKSPATVVESFSFPEEIQGCSCYFAKDRADFEAQRYIYADDFGKNAIMTINGRQLSFPLDSRDFSDSQFKKKLRNAEFSIEITADRIDESEETTMFSGKMTVTAADGQSVTMPVYGECGC